MMNREGLNLELLVAAGLLPEEAEYLAAEVECREAGWGDDNEWHSCRRPVPGGCCRKCGHLLVLHYARPCDSPCSVCECEDAQPCCDEHVPEFLEMGAGI